MYLQHPVLGCLVLINAESEAVTIKSSAHLCTRLICIAPVLVLSESQEELAGRYKPSTHTYNARKNDANGTATATRTGSEDLPSPQSSGEHTL